MGTHLEEDDDLDTCPARTRAAWPRQITPWWTATHRYEKPPYSYATLIAHAILSSKDGRLTLSDIYKWISEHYPYYVPGQHGWQNSIRHNLSLNKKWFLKLDRRPTQANPGKGCYWTLVAGTEQYFIDQLTQAGGHSRKHHDIGLTAELSIGNHRRGSCYYGRNNNTNTNNRSDDSTPNGSTAVHHGNMLITRPEDYEAPKKAPAPPLGMYTTFRMADMDDKSKTKRENGSLHKQRTNKKRRPQQQRNNTESGYDSGVDVSSKYVQKAKAKQKQQQQQQKQQQQQQQQSSPSTTIDDILGAGDYSWQDNLLDVAVPFANLDINDSTFLSYLPQGYDANNVQDQQQEPWVLPTTSNDWFQGTMSTPAYMFGTPLLDHTGIDTNANQVWDPTTSQEAWSSNDFLSPVPEPAVEDIQPSLSYPTLLASRYEPPQQESTSMVPLNDQQHESYDQDSKVEDCLRKVLSYQQCLQQQQQQFDNNNNGIVTGSSCFHTISSYANQVLKSEPIVINLDDEEVTTKYLHFEEDQADADDEDDGDDEEENITSSTNLCNDTPTSVLEEYGSMSALLFA